MPKLKNSNGTIWLIFKHVRGFKKYEMTCIFSMSCPCFWDWMSQRGNNKRRWQNFARHIFQGCLSVNLVFLYIMHAMAE